jgi:hypothetical protein
LAELFKAIRGTQGVLKKIEEKGVDVSRYGSSAILSSEFKVPQDWEVAHLGEAVKAFRESGLSVSKPPQLVFPDGEWRLRLETKIINASNKSALEKEADDLVKAKLFFECVFFGADPNGIPKPPIIPRGKPGTLLRSIDSSIINEP